MPADPVVAQESDGTAFAEVQCHCSDDDGVPDVGVSVGLGCGKALWIGELLTRDGATCGMVMHDGTKRIVAPFADGTDWQDVADILRHHVGPALAAHRTPTPASGDVPSGWKLVPIEPTDDMVAAGLGQRGNLHPADSYRRMLSASPTPDSSAVSGSAADAETYSPEDEALYTRWLAGDEDLPILEREQHLRFASKTGSTAKPRSVHDDLQNLR